MLMKDVIWIDSDSATDYQPKSGVLTLTLPTPVFSSSGELRLGLISYAINVPAQSGPGPQIAYFHCSEIMHSTFGNKRMQILAQGVIETEGGLTAEEKDHILLHRVIFKPLRALTIQIVDGNGNPIVLPDKTHINMCLCVESDYKSS